MFTSYINNKAQASVYMPTLMHDQNLQPMYCNTANCKSNAVSLGVDKLCRHNFEHIRCEYMEGLIILRIVLATTIKLIVMPYLWPKLMIPRAQSIMRMRSSWLAIALRTRTQLTSVALSSTKSYHNINFAQSVNCL